MSDAQERNLIVLADRHPLWTFPGFRGTRANTLASLEDQGLAESQFAVGRFKYRITDAGRCLIGTMGD